MNTGGIFSAARVPVLGLAAFSGTGKTTLLKKLLPRLTQRGFRVGLIKHSHHSFEIDQPGKDSYELRRAGANPVMLSSSHRRALMTEHRSPAPPALSTELAHFDQSGLDLILVEGFKRERFPKIELTRPSLGHPLLFPDDESVIAVASDAPLPLPATVPLLDLNDPAAIARFIIDEFLGHGEPGSLR